MSKHVFIHGGYQSVDILLWDPFTTSYVPLASPATQLVPNREYSVQARVYNTFATSASAVVGIKQALGGIGSNATYLPGGFPLNAVMNPNSSALTPAIPGGAPKFNAPSSGHTCIIAVVRCNIGGEDCTTDAVTDPGLDGNLPQCTAWRNCESITMHAPRMNTAFNVNLTAFGSVPEKPTLLRASAVHAPRKWFDTAEVLRATEIMEQSGAAGYPPFLLKSLAHTLKPVDLGLRFETFCHGIKISSAKRLGWHLHAEYGAIPDVVLMGKIPKSAYPGDVYLVRARAAYPASKLDVEFLQVIWIVE